MLEEFECIGSIIERQIATNLIPRGDSILEERFWEMVRKTQLQWFGSVDQFEIGQYRVDAIFDCDGHAVVIELDGAAYHRNPQTDLIRDSSIARQVSAVIRIPYGAMWHYPRATFKVLGQWFPRFYISDNSNVVSAGEAMFNFYPSEIIDRQFQVYQMWDTAAYVGSPRNFVEDAIDGPYRISIRRGRTDPEILDRIGGHGG